MILNDLDISWNILKDNIKINPYNPAMLGPNSYDLTLAPTLLVYIGDVLDVRTPNTVKTITIPEDGLILEPGELYLGKTNEYTETHNLVPMLEGISSNGRLGIGVHETAGFGDNGFCGNWTLEITVTKRVRIYPNMRIAQLYWLTMTNPYGKKYQGKYQEFTTIEASKSWMDYR